MRYLKGHSEIPGGGEEVRNTPNSMLSVSPPDCLNCSNMGTNNSHLSVSSKIVSITHNVWRERRSEAGNQIDIVCLPAKHFTARPNQVTQTCLSADRNYVLFCCSGDAELRRGDELWEVQQHCAGSRGQNGRRGIRCHLHRASLPCQVCSETLQCFPEAAGWYHHFLLVWLLWFLKSWYSVFCTIGF